ncbi:MAG: SGNH/GDSL hydrolase family protein, partial [Alphaproteobacteria bacterium]
VVVVAIGSNDRQQIKQDGKRHAPLSSGWEAAYEGRIEGIADTLKVFGRPFFWVGAPPMRGRSASRDMAYFNGLYKPRIVETGGYFIDIWNGFTNEDGRFVSSGPDVEGNLRALRNKDGINFSRAGRLKLAFYVEREMKRQIGFTTGAKSVLLLSSPTSQIEIGPDGEKRLVGPVVSLVGPRPGARDALVGDREGEDGASAPVPEQPDDRSPHYLLVIEGASLPLVPGRADDYRWPPVRDSQAEVTPSPASLPGGT